MALQYDIHGYLEAFANNSYVAFITCLIWYPYLLPVESQRIILTTKKLDHLWWDFKEHEVLYILVNAVYNILLSVTDSFEKKVISHQN